MRSDTIAAARAAIAKCRASSVARLIEECREADDQSLAECRLEILDLLPEDHVLYPVAVATAEDVRIDPATGSRIASDEIREIYRDALDALYLDGLPDQDEGLTYLLAQDTAGRRARYLEIDAVATSAAVACELAHERLAKIGGRRE